MMTEPVPTSDVGLTRRRVIFGGSLIALSATALARAPKSTAPPLPLEALQKLVPNSLGNWKFETSSGLIVPPADPGINELYNEVLTRVYIAPSRSPIMLLIAYSNRQDGMLQLHRPEFCYPASGLRIMSEDNVAFSVAPGLEIPARAMTAQGRGRTEQLAYWTRIGRDYPRTWLEQRLAVAKNNVAGVIPDGVLVRISTLDPSWKQAEPSIRDFAAALGQNLQGRAKTLIVGG
jgi:EpsI family protein